MLVQQIFCISFPNLLHGSYFSASSSVEEETRRTLSRHGACAHTLGGLGADSVLAQAEPPLSTGPVITFPAPIHDVSLLYIIAFREKLHRYPAKNWKSFKYEDIALPNILPRNIIRLEPF